MEEILNVIKIHQENKDVWKNVKYPAIITVQKAINYALQRDPIWYLDTSKVYLMYKGENLNWNKILYRICECELKNMDGNTHLSGHIGMRYFTKEQYKMKEKVLPCIIKEKPDCIVYISWDNFCCYLDRIFREMKSFVDEYRIKYNQIKEE